MAFLSSGGWICSGGEDLCRSSSISRSGAAGGPVPELLDLEGRASSNRPVSASRSSGSVCATDSCLCRPTVSRTSSALASAA
jgi:hypothetical protein